MSTQIAEQTVSQATKTLIVAALALVASLAWNDAITSSIKAIWPNSNKSLIGAYIYALTITVVVVLIAKLVMWRPKKKTE